MSIDSLPATAAPDGTRIYLDTTGAGPIPDEALIAWRRAAVDGGLPEPTRTRWQQLRAGVVNMWEFDAAEYWSADGRAQFVGRNEQGKSTMMSMTTLTMLTGDLSPRYVDTFGDSHRTFRYYLEPTEDPKDRRTTDNQLNRGWTWVEYGRLTETGPEYFTTLLFVQARRTSPDLTKKWLTHTGPERVRDGITLLHQQAVVTAGELASQPGLTPHPSGRAYAKTVASTLFGFTDPERLRTVVELLKTLRTPKLGNRLNPDWVIERIREALPPLDAGEVSELAEGWDQLGQLAADRDAAREAQEAVTAYVKSTWNPWADATLRLAADDLVSAVTALDDVTRQERAAQQRFDRASADFEAAEAKAADLEVERDEVSERRDTLLQSQAYRAAANAGQQVTNLTSRVKTLETAHGGAQDAETRARERVDSARRTHESSESDVARAEARAADHVEVATRAAATAGLPDDSASWAAGHDTARLQTAIDERLVHVREAGKLAAEAGRRRAVVERDAQLLAAAERDANQRRQAETAARDEFELESQALSDALEAWAGRIASDPARVTAPAVADRERWLAAVFAECDRPRPAQRLAGLVREEWTQPVVQPLEAAAVTAENDARAAQTRARDADADADRLERETTPVPDAPHNWRRRVRPASGPGGAPLWELLDPAPGLAAADLAGLEAALAGAGLLDAWVTVDGLWREDRDGDDHVLAVDLPAAAGDTLRSVLTLSDPVQDGQPMSGLASTVTRVLDGVGWRRSASGAGTWVSADGGWSTPTTTGRAVVPETGASLLGATARAQARARRVAQLRDQARQERDQAAELSAAAASHRDTVARIRDLGSQAPGDGEVLGAARDLATASAEAERAVREEASRVRVHDQSQAAVAEADAALLTYASEKALDPARLTETTGALQQAQASVAALSASIANLAHARATHALHEKHLEQADGDADRARAAAAEAERQLNQARVALNAARDALGTTEQDLLAEGDRLGRRLKELQEDYRQVTRTISDLSEQRGQAQVALETVEEKRRQAEAERSARLSAWWVPVDAGLAAARGVAMDADAPRTLTSAVAQARAFRSERRAPRGWPDTPGHADSSKERVLSGLRDRLSGQELLRLNNTLTRTGGRSAIVEPDETTGLPRVLVLIDASSARFAPADAIRALSQKAVQLGELHDEQMHKVMEELLASTFVDHLRDKVKQTENLLHDVNQVLAQHPTGTTRTVVRLVRKQLAEHKDGFQVLNRLLADSVDSPAVQQQVQEFLSAQIRAAQDEGHAEGRDWKELLVDKLDYRNWFAVVTEWRVLESAKAGGTQTWHELTRERHGQDSGGGKVMTMLQPLLATLATLYDNSPTAARPLWLDEAFDGVDAQNTTSLLGMLVDFDFDFMLAGPSALVASRNVPCAAVWIVNRAAAPTPGVDLGLWLYAAGTKEKVELGTQTWRDAATDTKTVERDDDQRELWS